MLLIADAGSTKTAWRLIEENQKIHQFNSEGIHPLFTQEENISQILRQQLCTAIGFPDSRHISELFFYGAGCSHPERSQIVRNALAQVFPDAKITVESDLLGAARGLCGHQEGIAAILGTGSASCEYDGINIRHSRPSLGYILGDEGSGAFLGKTLLRDLLYGEVPVELSEQFFAHYQPDKEKIIRAVYQEEYPNRYLASFSKFIFRHLQNEYCARLVYDSFLAFLDAHIRHYDISHLEFNATGSVAYFYGKILKQACNKMSIRLNSCTENPIAGLTLYHLNEI